MPGNIKPQRIRDPVHNLISFDTSQLERCLWEVVKTRPFQRLRRIRQLGFSELIYPGATHTRFAHSIGVFHTARQLMTIIVRHLTDQHRLLHDRQRDAALAAALVHDIGHGMFSHAFEDVGKRLDLKMARHEHVSEVLILDSEVGRCLNAEMGTGFATDVAAVIGRGKAGNLYDAVVSSQFDADRLDYMQRDRLMTGVQNSGIDLTWLMANLEIGDVPIGADEQQAGKIETFVLGPKASHAAETYVLGLFQLYPTVYFHKTTRAAEKVFSELLFKTIQLSRDNSASKTGLPAKHPIVCFAKHPEKLENVLSLDDFVFWGALPMLANAADEAIRTRAVQLRDRKLPKCVDIRAKLLASVASANGTDGTFPSEIKLQIDRRAAGIEQALRSWSEDASGATSRILIDRTDRDPYKRFQESKGPLNQIRIRGTDNRIRDIAEGSPMISALQPFEVFRAYYDEQDVDAKAEIERIVAHELRGNNDGAR